MFISTVITNMPKGQGWIICGTSYLQVTQGLRDSKLLVTIVMLGGLGPHM